MTAVGAAYVLCSLMCQSEDDGMFTLHFPSFKQPKLLLYSYLVLFINHIDRLEAAIEAPERFRVPGAFVVRALRPHECAPAAARALASSA